MTPDQDDKRSTIHVAAVEQFSQNGYAGTSMANIADAAGMSRPALYQYFRNKNDIFTSAFVGLLSDHVDRALLALTTPGSIDEQLDGFLQRFEGDIWEHLAASPHAEELLRAKGDDVAAALTTVIRRLWHGLERYLEELCGDPDDVHAARRADWVDVLHFSPKGFKFDHPTVETYRRRLRVLARGVAAEVQTYQ